MRIRCFAAILLAFLSMHLYAAAPGYEFGIGSGYVFYGSSATKSRNKDVGSSNQLILSTDAAVLFPLEKGVSLSAGIDGTLDARWNGGDHIYLFDYAFLLGFRVYPGLGGLLFSADYALGRRTDFISIDDTDDSEHTDWGNGFKCSLAYDFSYHTSGFAPVVGLSIRNMPRGNSRDTILGIFLRLTKHN